MNQFWHTKQDHVRIFARFRQHLARTCGKNSVSRGHSKSTFVQNTQNFYFLNSPINPGKKSRSCKIIAKISTKSCKILRRNFMQFIIQNLAFETRSCVILPISLQNCTRSCKFLDRIVVWIQDLVRFIQDLVKILEDHATYKIL